MSSHVFASIVGVDDGRSSSSLILTLLVLVLCPAGQEADENQPLLLLRRLRGQAGPALSVDELLHRCGGGGGGGGYLGRISIRFFSFIGSSGWRWRCVFQTPPRA